MPISCRTTSCQQGCSKSSTTTVRWHPLHVLLCQWCTQDETLLLGWLALTTEERHLPILERMLEAQKQQAVIVGWAVEAIEEDCWVLDTTMVVTFMSPHAKSPCQAEPAFSPTPVLSLLAAVASLQLDMAVA
ncbi:hypothetical protein Y1Q_0004572 [Alligator mississippiensis]|uniref:Uncharacterized protein n=1 Tax=Alligator mississippiensis TaxID=8496 RepID=A0A151MHW4_ALLMI|nr:hypothetical protein Y1Q_0004572 [Alligator mississippiensis]